MLTSRCPVIYLILNFALLLFNLYNKLIGGVIACEVADHEVLDRSPVSVKYWALSIYKIFSGS